MSNDNIGQWDGRYQAKTHRSMWPWSDLVSLCERFVRPSLGARADGAEVNILEVGCGYGANIPYLLTLEGAFHGIDGSETALKEMANRFPFLADKLACADFTKDLFFKKPFDLVVDRASITCNADSSIRNCVSLIHSKLRRGGHFCGVAWYGKENSDYKGGVSGGDCHTRMGYTEGQFAHTGTVHFTDEANLKDILSEFEIVWIEHKISREIVPASGRVNAFYNFVARKV